MASPKVFISYSHDSQAHKDWVLGLATDLRTGSVDAILDIWDLSPGQDTVAFMTNGIVSSERVLLICSENYVNRSNGGSGGTGYEGLIISAQMVQNIDTKKFIPLIRGNATIKKMPDFLGQRLYIDFTSDSLYKSKLEELLREILQQPSKVKPPLGPNPFSAAPVSPPVNPRLAGPSGLSVSGAPILDDAWFSGHVTAAKAGLAALKLSGSMELRFALHSPINKSQLDLLTAVRNSEIHTFGWPIGITLENTDKYRPRPLPDGIKVEVPTTGFAGEPSYDYWAARLNGDFYLLQSLFEDGRLPGTPGKIFFDTRIVRVTESLMFCANLYTHLGAASDSKISIRVTHAGLKDRQLIAASQNRFLFPSVTTADLSQTELTVSLNEITPRLVDNVMQIIQPLFMLFEFRSFDKSIYQDIVSSFQAGRIS